MSKFSQQLIQDQYKNLPEELRAAIYSTDIAEKMFDIGRKFALTIEKNGFLAEETAFVVLGLTKPGDFTTAIKNRLGIADDEAGEIAKEVSSQIFFPIREALKKAHQIDIEEDLELRTKNLAETKSTTASPVKPSEPTAPKPPEPPQNLSGLTGQAKPFIPKVETPPAATKPEVTPRLFVRPVTEEKLSTTPPPPLPPRQVEPSTKEPTPKVREEELIPPPPKPKIAPIDLRQGAKPRLVPPEFMRDALFAPPSLESRSKNQELRTTEAKNKKQEVGLANDTPIKEGKVVPKSRSFDPYKEPID